MIHVLPPTSWVPYPAHALAKPQVVWRGMIELQRTELSEYAYCTPLPGDSAGAYLAASKTFMADRYGGGGLKSNGGGARCGIWGEAQVKGLGRNCLAGSQTSFWHAYGGASLAECIREAIWGEVCHAALPFGALRLYGLIKTGTEVPRPARAGDDAAPSTARGLAVREIALRPAHFIRANYFSRRDEQQHGLVADHARTANAVRSFQAACQGLFGGAGSLNDNFSAIVRRAAIQLAAARAKRIAHGALTASNFCLDGRWLDFGTMSTVSDFGPIIVATGMPDATEQHSLLRASISDLHAALKRHLPPQEAAELAGEDVFWSHLMSALEHGSQVEFAKLTGIPTDALASASPALLARFYACTSKIISHSGEPFKLFDNPVSGQPQMPQQMGRYALDKIMVTLATSTSADTAERRLETELGDPVLRRETVTAYSALRSHFLTQRRASADGRHRLLCFSALNAVRVNTPVPALYRHHLEADIDALLTEGGDIDAGVTRHVERAGELLNEPRAGNIALDAALGVNAVTCSEQALTVGTTAIGLDSLIKLLPPPDTACHLSKLQRLMCDTAT